MASRFPWPHAMLLSAAMATAHATAGDELAPRWTLQLTDVARAVTSFPGEPSKPWVRTSDGGALVAMSYDGSWPLFLHRFDAAGTLIARTRASLPDELDAHGHLVLQPGADGSTWMLRTDVSPTRRCELSQISASGQVIARVRDAFPCKDLQRLPSGDLALLGYQQVRLLAADGAARWSAQLHEYIGFTSSIQPRTGELWAAGWKGGETPSPVVVRFDQTGSVLGITDGLSTYHAESRLAAYPDGGALWFGGNPGFLTRLAPDGSVMWTRLPPPGHHIESVLIGGDGRIYASGSDRTVSGIDEQTGEAMWTTSGSALHTTAAGISLLVDRGNYAEPDLRLRQIDAQGAILSDAAVVDTGMIGRHHLQGRADGSVEYIGRYAPQPRVDACPSDSRLRRVAPDGSITTFAQVCEAPSTVTPFDLLPDVHGGLLLNASSGLYAYSAHGRRRWHYTPCDLCSPDLLLGDGPFLEPVAATVDGGAWVVQQNLYPDTVNARLIGLGSDGRPTADHDLSGLPHFNTGNLRLSTDGSAAMLFWTDESGSWGDIGWARVTRDGRLSTGTRPIAPSARIGLIAVRAIDDGDHLVAFTPDTHPWYCPPLLYCGTIRTAVRRVTAAGHTVWHHDIALEDGFHFALDASGVTWVATVTPLGYRIQRISPAGRADPSFFVSARSEHVWLESIHLPVANRLLLVEGSVMQLVDLAGNFLAGVEFDFYRDSIPVSQSRYGYVAGEFTSEGGLQVSLYDSFDLAPSVVAQLPSTDAYPRRTQLSNGAIAIAQSERWPQERVGAQLAVFDVPGTPSAAKLWSDGFEP